MYVRKRGRPNGHMKWRKKILNMKYPLKLILRPVSKQTTFFAMIFIEPDGCFRQVSTTLGLFEGRRTQQTTFILKRFTKIWSKKPFFTRNCAARTFQNSKLYSCERKSIQMVWKKKVCNWQKKVLQRKRDFFFWGLSRLYLKSGWVVGRRHPFAQLLLRSTYYSWKEPHWQKLVRKSKNRVSVTERKISSEKSAYL